MDTIGILLFALFGLLIFLIPLYFLGKIAERAGETNALLRHIIELQWPDTTVSTDERPRKTLKKKV